MIDKLPASVVDSGKDHPFVIALVKEMRLLIEQIHGACEAAATVASADGMIRGSLGQSAGIRLVLRKIENAKGRDDAE